MSPPGLSNYNNTTNPRRDANASTAPPTMTNPYVQSRSIQTTLTSLTNETHTLREETRRLDSQRLALQERMKQHVQLQQHLDQDIHVAQDQLGTYHRQHTMLAQEQTRLETQLGEERHAMQTCATEYEGLLKREKERKIQFCKDIAAANQEMGDLLKQEDEERLLRKINPVCHDLMKDVFEMANKNATTAAVAAGGTTASFDKLAAEMENALEVFASAARNKDHALAEKEQVQQEIEILRDLALQGGAAGKNLSPDMLMSLEGVWQEDWQADEEEERGLASGVNEATLGSPVHMQLFYDQVIGHPQQQDPFATEDDGADDLSMPPPPPPLRKQSAFQQQQEQQYDMAMDSHHEQHQQ